MIDSANCEPSSAGNKAKTKSDKKELQNVVQKRRNGTFMAKNTLLPTQYKSPFSCFVNTLLDFQLSEHERFLSKFLMLFQCIDTDCDGIISNSEFIELYDKMNILEHNAKDDTIEDETAKKDKFDIEISQFLEILDPFKCDKITLSDIIHLFSSYKLDLMDSDTSTKNNSLNHTQHIGVNLH